MRDQPDRDLGDLLLHAARGLRRGWAAALEPLDLPPHLARALVVLGRRGAPPRPGVGAGHLRLTPRAAPAGGDTTRGPLNLCLTAMGEVPSGAALRRDGARVGDDLWVSGQIGLAALGLAQLQARTQLPEALVSRWITALQRARPIRPAPVHVQPIAAGRTNSRRPLSAPRRPAPARSP